MFVLISSREIIPFVCITNIENFLITTKYYYYFFLFFFSKNIYPNTTTTILKI